MVEGKNVGKVDHSTYHVFHEGNETRMDRISEGADDDGSSTYFEFHPNSKLLKKVALKSSFVGRNFGNEVILDATLIAGEPKTYVSVSEIIYGGQTILDETKSKIIEYLGTEDITTPAGTFTTCKTKITETSVQMSGSDGGKLNVVEIVEWRTKGSGSLVQSTAALPEKGYKQTKTLTAISSI
ncbi:hypothetical protein [Vibrio taketomensis]|uniref:hypothetical protein n=1 Tax=Vibrio taketomensis TaxID=2572923 RepID=UPI0013894CBF|nr:hypothetical protein [Vibrio taketomensis]